MIRKLLGGVRFKIKSWFGVEIRVINQKEASRTRSINRIRKLAPGRIFETNLLGKPIKANHPGSFLFLYRELFELAVYEFKTTKEKPVIIDCGVNIGLSVIYFKQRYPKAKILGFEPDSVLYSLAKHNIETMGFNEVDLIQKGIWREHGKMSFFAEGTDAGRIAKSGDVLNLLEIETVRLSEYINGEVDFLKIDIEGAELDVLEECAHKLHNVNQLFVEYHSFTHEKQQLSRLMRVLENAGFRYNISCPKVFNPKPFVLKTDYLGMDFLLNIYAYR